MEIIKKPLENNITKVEIGAEYNESSNQVSGTIELDIENQAYFVEMINAIFENGKSKVIVDMHLVNYIDSSGLWAIFESHKKAAQKSGKLVLLNPTKDVQRVLDITKMSSKIAIFQNEKDALTGLTEQNA